MTRGASSTARDIDVFGLRIQDTTLHGAAETIVSSAAAGANLRVGFVNAHCVNEMHKNTNYRASLEGFDILYADGMGMRIAANAVGETLADNVNGTDLFPILCEQAADAGVPIFLLGARDGLADRTARRMASLYPGLNVAGSHHGYFKTQAEERALIDMINKSGAEILFVALGVPLQELWIERNRPRLRPSVIVGVGGLFDYYSGRIPRAPVAMRRTGMEWLWRLAMEPSRLWRRYILGNAEFLGRVALMRFLKRPSMPKSTAA